MVVNEWINRKMRFFFKKIKAFQNTYIILFVCKIIANCNGKRETSKRKKKCSAVRFTLHVVYNTHTYFLFTFFCVQRHIGEDHQKVSRKIVYKCFNFKCPLLFSLAVVNI